jgi:transposase InsO family protein
MCRFLGVARSNVYYKTQPKKNDTEAENAVIKAFRDSRGNYGALKIKKALLREQLELCISKRRIRRIMEKYGLVSKYVKRRKKGRKGTVNEANTPNILNRQFAPEAHDPMDVVVSDLTYVKVAGTWHYICLLLDVATRQIIGFACGKKKDGELVKSAFYSVKQDLRRINLFHTDRGSEFKNSVIESILIAFGIERSLSAKGTPHDNAVSESLYNIVKTELVFDERFNDLEDLEVKLFDYVNWYNNERIHSALGYLSPREYVAGK